MAPVFWGCNNCGTTHEVASVDDIPVDFLDSEKCRQEWGDKVDAAIADGRDSPLSDPRMGSADDGTAEAMTATDAADVQHSIADEPVAEDED